LFEVSRAGEGNNRRLIFARLNYSLDKRARGCLLLRQGALLRSADVDQKGDRKWSIRFALKSENLLRHAIFNHPQVLFPQCRNEGFLFVGGGEEQVSEIGVHPNYFVILAGWVLRRKMRGKAGQQ